MATLTLVPLDVYLTSDYRPDCDWIDGEVRERNMGEGQHSTVQTFLIAYFYMHRQDWKIRVLTEQRVQVAPTRFRIPDVALASAQAPFEPIVKVPPLLCVEVVSSGQRMAEIDERAKDYLAMGVPTVWIIDPLRRTAFLSDAAGQRQVTEELVVPGTAIKVTLAEVFAELNELEGL